MIRCNRYELIFDVQSIQLFLYFKNISYKENRTNKAPFEVTLKSR